jgi:hypothetical protein
MYRRPKWEVFGRASALFLLSLGMFLIGWTGLRVGDALNRPIADLLPILVGATAVTIIALVGQWALEFIRSKN